MKKSKRLEGQWLLERKHMGGFKRRGLDGFACFLLSSREHKSAMPLSLLPCFPLGGNISEREIHFAPKVH